LATLCVFCGSRSGIDPRYERTAVELADALAERGHRLVFGGGSVGLMGKLADRMLERGAEVTGVIPESLARKELLHDRVTDTRVVVSMHERKALMAELADAFIAMPGGYGTFEELFEVVTWAQLGLHRKSIGLLNVGGYFDPLVRLIDHAIQEGFIAPAHRDLILIEERPVALLDGLATHVPPPVEQWIEADET
jgi:uncharacterized protein (TIGR00730 family)